jgi:inorganic pyrophosphatase
MHDEKGPDEKILCVPVADPMWNYLQTLDDVPPHLLREIEHFFTIYKDLEKKKTGVEGWNKDLTETFRIIKESQERYTQNQE